ncbi:MAG: hypothetical protein CO127_04010 [Ignavibacteria bacterium CG_4_9_14_3_um_filter_36_18]|nr:BamA/TamA family outer membrane protein [Candidatus Parcubacteria bacterium]PJB01403.1 MAG: hypothetical protein CO127_04010 [Ignavibacteria bacterium CG_4_9_14_3_um_filter_36_18]
MVKKFLFITLLLSSQACSQAFFDYELDAINFSGNNAYSSSELRAVVLSVETPWWGWKFLNSLTSWGSPAVYFDSSYISIDILSLKNFYRDRGFFNADIRYTIEADSSDKTVELNYLINEGTPANFGTVKFFGLNPITWKANYAFTSEVTFDTTDRFIQGESTEKTARGIGELQNNGYMLATWDSTRAFVDTSNRKVDMDVFVSPEILYKISGFIIEKDGEGKDKVSDVLLTDITGIKPGEDYDRNKIKRSQNRLARTGLFNSIIVEPSSKDTVGDQVPLLIKGNIGFMNELSPELVFDNYQNYFNLGVGANFIQKNFLGRARKLTLQAKVSVLDIFNTNLGNIFKAPDKRDSIFQGAAEFLAKIEQPYIFNRPIFGNLELYIKSLFLTTNTSLTYGGKLTFDFEMPEYTFVNQLKPYFNLEENIFTSNDIGTIINSSGRAGVYLTIKSLTPLLGVEVGASHTDNIFFPSKGFNLSTLLETGEASTTVSFGGDSLSVFLQPGETSSENKTAFFYKTQISISTFLGLDRVVSRVLAAKFKTGYIQTYSGDTKLIPPNRTFFAGGSNSVRGWRSRELAPRDSTEFLGVDFSNSPRGGTFLLEGSLELRQRFLESFGAVAFFDFGNTWNGYKKISFPDIAVAAGLGFRYYSPIAPFRLDFGFKFYDPSNRKFIFDRPFWSTLQFHFGIGEAF